MSDDGRTQSLYIQEITELRRLLEEHVATTFQAGLRAGQQDKRIQELEDLVQRLRAEKTAIYDHRNQVLLELKEAKTESDHMTFLAKGYEVEAAELRAELERIRVARDQNGRAEDPR